MTREEEILTMVRGIARIEAKIEHLASEDFVRAAIWEGIEHHEYRCHGDKLELAIAERAEKAARIVAVAAHDAAVEVAKERLQERLERRGGGHFTSDNPHYDTWLQIVKAWGPIVAVVAALIAAILKVRID